MTRNGLRLVQEDLEGSFIDVSQIVRSVYLSPTYNPETQDRLFYVNDQIDHSGDIFLRLKAIEYNLV